MKIGGADWEREERHTTELAQQQENSVLLVHRMDRDSLCFFPHNVV